MKTSFLFLTGCLFLLCSCAPKPAASIDVDSSAPAEVSTFQNPVPRNSVVSDPHHGKETGLALCPLAGIAPALANGVVIEHSFEDGGAVVTVQLNIAQAPAGQSYQAWLEDMNGKAKPIAMGSLRTATNDVQHSLRFDTDLNLKDMSTVVVSLEENANPTSPGKAVASCILKTTNR